MTYLHLYNNDATFQSAYTGEDYLEPWVSYTEETERVDYNKPPVPFVWDFIFEVDQEGYYRLVSAATGTEVSLGEIAAPGQTGDAYLYYIDTGNSYLTSAYTDDVRIRLINIPQEKGVGDNLDITLQYTGIAQGISSIWTFFSQHSLGYGNLSLKFELNFETGGESHTVYAPNIGLVPYA